MRPIKPILMAALLLAACGSQHNADSIDSSLTLTEDSISFDICIYIRMRNVMGIWIDSTGIVYLNHDYLELPPPPPPPGENYEYEDEDDRNVCDISLVREKVKQFFANPDDDPNLPEKRMENIPFLGEYPVSMGLVSIHIMEGASEKDINRVRHEIAAAVIDLRDALARKVFGLHYGELSDDQTAAIRAAIPTATYDATRNRFYQISDKNNKRSK